MNSMPPCRRRLFLSRRGALCHYRKHWQITVHARKRPERSGANLSLALTVVLRRFGTLSSMHGDLASVFDNGIMHLFGTGTAGGAQGGMSS